MKMAQSVTLCCENNKLFTVVCCRDVLSVIILVIIGWKSLYSIVNTLLSENGLHACGNNSTKSEPIWMRSGTMWAKCGGLALADFGQSVLWRLFDRGCFSKKKQKLLTKFPGLATSGCHNSAVSTNAENARPNGPPTRCLVSIFTIWINSKSFSWTVRCVQENYLAKFLAIVDGHCGHLAA